MTSTLRVTASNKFTLFDLKTRQIAVRNAFWKGSFVRIAAVRCALQKGLLCGLCRSSVGFAPMSVGYAFLSFGAVQRD